MKRVFVLLTIVATACQAAIIPDVRAAITRNAFSEGEALIEKYKAERGVTPEMLEALSWLGRGALVQKQYDAANRYAAETRKLSLEELKKRPLDAEKNLPIALGASIEVQGHVMAARGDRSGAVAFLQKELAAWRDTSIRTRIQKNINLLSLEGKAAPALETKEWIGAKPTPVAELKGKPVLLFFWAHWCGDCKYQAPILARLQKENAGSLVVVGPTQRYGYTARGQDAKPDEEKAYIEQIRQQHFANVDMTIPLSEENFKAWGASSTPTLVLIDRRGTVRLYHPGRMTYEDLAPRVAELVKSAT